MAEEQVVLQTEEKVIISEEEAVQKFADIEQDLITLNIRVDNQTTRMHDIEQNIQTNRGDALQGLRELEAVLGDRLNDLEDTVAKLSAVAKQEGVSKNEFNMLAQAIQLIGGKLNELTKENRKLALRQEEVVHIVNGKQPSLFERLFGKAPGDGPQPQIPYLVNYMKTVEDNLQESWTHFPCFWSLKERKFYYFKDDGKVIYLIMHGLESISLEWHEMTESNSVYANQVVNATSHHKTTNLTEENPLL